MPVSVEKIRDYIAQNTNHDSGVLKLGILQEDFLDDPEILWEAMLTANVKKLAIHIAHHNTSKTINVLCKKLLPHADISFVDFSDSHINNPQALAMLGKGLRDLKNRFEKEIEVVLSANYIQDKKALTALCKEVLPYTNNIAINLSDNRINSPEALMALGHGLSNLERIIEIDLSDNRISEAKEINALAKGLLGSRVRYLNLSNNSLSGIGCTEALLKMVNNNSNLCIINLENTSLSNENKTLIKKACEPNLSKERARQLLEWTEERDMEKMPVNVFNAIMAYDSEYPVQLEGFGIIDSQTLSAPSKAPKPSRWRILCGCIESAKDIEAIPLPDKNWVEHIQNFEDKEGQQR
ncbi:MAG: Leucinerich repeat [Rickettsiaceae bacterium]|jgi:hypothetical protein|nr:Leucinerich repeat [Rickettsiaceae bacterium]